MNMVCEIIKDLIPICVDGIASKISNKMVHRHIKNCHSCKEYYKLCKNSTVAAEVREMQNKENNDLIYLPDDGYLLVAERVEKSLKIERIAIISAAVAAITATIVIFTLAGKKHKD